MGNCHIDVFESMCTSTANTDFILRHTTAPPIPSTSQENISGCHVWTTLVETNALHCSYLQLIARERDGEAPITKRKSMDTFLKRKITESAAFIPAGTGVEPEPEYQHNSIRAKPCSQFHTRILVLALLRWLGYTS
jgi:hypothetical protein